MDAARSAAVAAALLFASAAPPAIGDVRVLSAVGMRQVLLDRGPAFERATGHRVTMSFDSSGVIARQLESGDSADVILINQVGLDRLAKAGAIADGSAAVATARVGMAVRRGAARPDISTPAAFTRVMLAARAVARPDPALDGSSGPHIAAVFERLGIAGTMKARTIYADPPGASATTPGSLVADGRADVALHQIQELMAVSGIELVAPLPDDLQQTFTFHAAISRQARDVGAARALVEFLRTPDSRAVIVAKGMGVP